MALNQQVPVDTAMRPLEGHMDQHPLKNIDNSSSGFMKCLEWYCILVLSIFTGEHSNIYNQ